LNAGAELLEPEERARVGELNLLASRQAQLATAYERARDYAVIGLQMLGDAGWTAAYDLTRDLHMQRMASEMFAGNAAGAKECFLAARARISPSSDRTLLHASWIGLQTSRGMFIDAIETGRERLRELGMVVPARVTRSAVMVRYAQTKMSQGGRPISELLHLEMAKDTTHIGMMRLLVALVPAAFFLDSDLLAWIHLNVVGLSLRHGVSDVSSYSFVGYGTVLAAVFDKHAEGDAFGRLGLALNERFKNDRLAAKVNFLYGGWVAWWVRPFRDGKEYLRSAHDLAKKYGDTSYETYSATVLSVVTFCESADLAALEETAEWAREVASRRKDRDMAGVPDAHARYAAALLGTTPSPRDLGLSSSSDEEFRASLSAKTPTAMFYYLFCNAELAYLFGDAARAHDLLEEAGKRVQVIFSLPTTAELCLLRALVAAKMHDSAPWTKRLQLQLLVASCGRELRENAKSCPENFEAHALLVSAELLRIRGAGEAADAAFERAVTAARVHRSVKREAFALDLASCHARASGDAARADRLRAEAIDAYRRWGAISKADDLSRAS
jgi:predicted ATPase